MQLSLLTHTGKTISIVVQHMKKKKKKNNNIFTADNAHNVSSESVKAHLTNASV